MSVNESSWRKAHAGSAGSRARLLIWLALFFVGCAAQEPGDEEMAALAQHVCARVLLTSDAIGAVKNSVLLTATPSCDVGQTPEYLFRYQLGSGGKVWVTLRNWSPAASATWNVLGLPSGPYTVQVLARAQGSTVAAESKRNLTLLVGDVCETVTLATDQVSPQPVGNIVKLLASANCGSGPAEYAFTVSSPSGQAIVLTDWSGSDTATWDTAGLSAGTYALRVSAKRTGHSLTEATASTTFRIGETCTASKLTLTPNNAPPDTPIHLAAAASCSGTASPEYRFRYRASGGKYSVVRDWAASATAELATLGLAEGSYAVRVDVRANDGAVDVQSGKSAWLTLGLCSAVAGSFAKTGPVPSGTQVVIRGQAACSPAITPSYRYSYRVSGSDAFSMIRDWSAETSISWDTTSLPQNDYEVAVQARGSESSPVFTSLLKITIGGSCRETMSLAAFANAPSANGQQTVWLRASGRACALGMPEYQFWYRRSSDPSDILLRDWAPASDFSFAFQGPAGDYTFLARKRAIGSQAAFQSSARSQTVSLGHVCKFSYAGVTVAKERLREQNVRVHALTSCTGAPAELLPYYRPAGSSEWLALPPVSHEWIEWDTRELSPGKYDLRLDLRPLGQAITDSWQGSYLLCAPGFDSAADGTCQDIDECNPYPQRACDALSSCTNTPGGHVCGSCPSGYTGDGETGCIPVSDEAFTSIAAGAGFNCGLSADGSVRCWGKNHQNQANPPSATFASIATRGSGDGMCGVRTDGEISCWGWNTGGSGLAGGPFQQVSASEYLVCGLRVDGTIVCQSSSNFQEVPPTGSFQRIAAGRDYHCGLRSNGSLACWGNNPPHFAKPNAALGPFRDVALGSDRVCGLRLDGLVDCFGASISSYPVPSGSFRSVAASGQATSTCGIRSDGSLECWGQLGNLPAGAFTQVAVGLGHYCALLEGGRVRCWGQQLFGEATPPGRKLRSIAPGYQAACSVDLDGHASCWGDPDMQVVPAPSGEFVTMSVGVQRACGVLADGGLACWGAFGSSAAQPPPTYSSVDVSEAIALLRGDGTAVGPDSVPLASGTFTQVSQALDHGCGLGSDGQIRCWGSSDTGESELSGVFSSVATGPGSTCGIRSNGSIECWTASYVGPFTPPAGAFKSVTLGYNAGCALTEEGDAVCWGDTCHSCIDSCYYLGSTCVPHYIECSLCSPPPGPFASIELAQDYSAEEYACGLRPDGTEVCWGGVVR